MHEAGYAHGGTVAYSRVFSRIRGTFTSLNLTFIDLNLRNLVFHNSRLSRLSEQELLEALGPPDPEKLTRLDGEPLRQGIPTQLVESAQWTGWPLDDDEDDENIRIIDLGEAFNQNAVPKRLAQPCGLQSPESIFTGEFEYRHDLWRVGLLVSTTRPIPSV
jgi:serine/threonine-protein kinase SRPK3